MKQLLPTKMYIKWMYKKKFGKSLDLHNPKTFNEKMQWLKIYDRKSEYTKMVDKYAVREYVSKKIGDEYLIPLLGVWEKFEDINFNELPDKFVLKCTHDSGGVMICKEKKYFDKNKAKLFFDKHLSNNYYYGTREYPYKNIKPKIIAEKYLEDEIIKQTPEDYKLMCFNGKVKCSFVCTERGSDNGLKVTFFDEYWKKLPFSRMYPASTQDIPKPINYDKMVELSEILASNIPFVRIDFYEVNNKLYFGEITFYPGSGLEEFTPVEWDYKLGELIKLPYKNERKEV